MCASVLLYSLGQPCDLLLTGQRFVQTKIGSMTKMMQEENESNFAKTLHSLLVCLVTIGGTITMVVFLYIMIGDPEESFGTALGFCVVLLIASIPIALKVRSFFMM